MCQFPDHLGDDPPAQHERMGNFEHEKDVQHKNVSRIKESQAFFGESKKREAKLVADADTGNLQTTSLSYGRVLEACVSCHKRYRD